MVGLEGARVIVVDDVVEEALPILSALRQEGIPAMFFQGGESEYPPEGKKLVGMRLAILDMQLVPGTTGENIVSSLLAFMEAVISKENGPYAVIAWTKHQEEVIELFKQRLLESDEIPNPVLVIPLEKGQYQNEQREFELAKLQRTLSAQMKAVSPLLYLQAWEGCSFRASTAVSNKLHDLARPDNYKTLAEWTAGLKENLLKLIAMMVREESPDVGDGVAALRALGRSLNPLHADQMELCSNKPDAEVVGISQEIVQTLEQIKGTLPPARVAATINAMVHVSPEQNEGIFSGNVYKLPSGDGWQEISFSEQDVATDLLQKTTKEEVWALLLKEIHAVLVDINPACDYAAGKFRVRRFVTGLLVPGNYKKQIKPPKDEFGEFNYHMSDGLFDLELNGSHKQYYLCLSARHLLTLDKEKAERLDFLFRLRTQATSAIQAWFSAHAVRQGLYLIPSDK